MKATSMFVQYGTKRQARHYVAYIICVTSLLTVTFPATAQEKKTTVPWEGTQAFRYLLHIYDQQPVKNIDDLRKLDPKQTTIIVFGDPNPLRRIAVAVRQRVNNPRVGGLADFQAAGGAILIATDRNDQGMLRTDFHITITGEHIRQQRNTSYKNNMECPFITEGLKTKHPLFIGLTKGIAANRPSRIAIPQLRDENSNLLPLLALYSDVHINNNFWNSGPHWHVTGMNLPLSANIIPLWFLGQFREQPRFPFMLGTVPNDFEDDQRVVILPGHGVFMNGMMVQPDNDNFRFAYNTIRWLTNDGKRKHVLFVEEGKIHETFEVPLTVTETIPVNLDQLWKQLKKHWPKILRHMVNNPGKAFELGQKFGPTIDKIVGKAEPLIAQLEKKPKNGKKIVLNILFDRFLNRHRVLQGMLIALTLLLAVRSFLKLIRSRRWAALRAPLSQIVVAGRNAGVPLVLQRNHKMIRQGSLWEASRVLARRWFETHSESEHLPHEPPRVVTTSQQSQRHWQRKLDELWDLAFGDPYPVPRSALQKLLQELHRLDMAYRKGRFRLEHTS